MFTRSDLLGMNGAELPRAARAGLDVLEIIQLPQDYSQLKTGEIATNIKFVLKPLFYLLRVFQVEPV